MRFLFVIILAFNFSAVNALENAPNTQSQIAGDSLLSDGSLLSKTKSIKNEDLKVSITLANQALQLSKKNDNHQVTAQTYQLLGKLSIQANDKEQALSYFVQAPIIYKSINNTQEEITSSLYYIDLLLSEKRYQQADKKLSELLLTAKKYGDKSLLGLVFNENGNSYYLQKNYKSAIEEYMQAVKYLSSSDNKTEKNLGEIYKHIAESYKKLKNRKQTVNFYKKALAVFTALKYKKYMAHTLNSLAEAERYLSHLEEALDYSIKSLEIHKTINDPEGFAKALTDAGIIYRNIGGYDKSLEYMYQAHLYYKKINDVNEIAETSNQLGFIYTRLRQFKKAKSYYQAVINVEKGKIKQKILASALRELAVIYLNDKEYGLALVMAKRSHKINKKENNKLNGSTTARIIANIYRDQHNNKEAISYYEESLILAKKSSNQSLQIKAEAELAEMLIHSDAKKAAEQLKKTLALSIKVNDKIHALDAYSKLRQAEKLLGNINESLRYAEEEIKLNKVIQKEKDDNELILIKAKLYLHSREVELTTLREKTKLDQLKLAEKKNKIEVAEKNRIITELQLTKNKYTNIVLILLLGLSVLLITFVYRLFVAAKKWNKELNYLATHDPLTHCYNRRALFDHMYLDFEKTTSLNEYCIIMVDIDHFKNVNDTYGHNAGDEVICGVADILQTCINENDIVARFGGEEFCVYLHQATDAQALEIAENIRYKVEVTHFNDISITCSSGVSTIKHHAKTYLELINQADLALYQSKSLGRNKVTMWDKAFEKKK